MNNWNVLHSELIHRLLEINVDFPPVDKGFVLHDCAASKHQCEEWHSLWQSFILRQKHHSHHVYGYGGLERPHSAALDGLVMNHPGRWTVASLSLVTPTLSHRHDTNTEEIKQWAIIDEREETHTVKAAIDGPTCWQMISFFLNRHTEASSQIPTFFFFSPTAGEKRSSHMNRGSYAEELVFTSCRTGEEGREKKKGGSRGGLKQSLPQSLKSG